jgi:hypothetical protein
VQIFGHCHSHVRTKLLGPPVAPRGLLAAFDAEPIDRFFEAERMDLAVVELRGCMRRAFGSNLRRLAKPSRK